MKANKLARFLSALVSMLILCTLTSGCGMFEIAQVPLPAESPLVTQEAANTAELTPEPTASQTAEPTPEPTAEPTPEPTPTPTPEPTPQYASLGFAGDVLIMQSQIEAARVPGGYDFKDTFRPMQALFESVDFMVLNFEGTLAGEKAGYTQPKPTPIPATEQNPNPPKLFQRFNAPDELVGDLMALGPNS